MLIELKSQMHEEQSEINDPSKPLMILKPATSSVCRTEETGALRWYDSEINNGILEGLNSMVQVAKAKVWGYRTFRNPKTLIYMLTGKLDYTKVGLPT